MDGWLFWLCLLCTCLLEVVAFDSSPGSVPSIDVYRPEHPHGSVAFLPSSSVGEANILRDLVRALYTNLML